MPKRLALAFVVAASFLSWALSAYVHYPTVPGSIYSDIVSFWYRKELAVGLTPCMDFFFEYPPTACFITYAARVLGGGSVEGYYTAFTLISLPAFLVLGWYMFRVAGAPAVAFVLTPTMILYGVYNYDHFHAAFMVVALTLFGSGRRGAAYALLGLAASVKFFAALLLPVLLMERFRWRYVALFLAGALPPALPLVVARPEYFVLFVDYHASWGLENAWTIWLTHDPFSPSAKVIGWVVAFALIVRGLIWSGQGVEKRCFLVVSGLLLGSPTFTPQMVIFLLPLAASVQPAWFLLPVVEASNAGIILTWFWVDNPILPWTLPQTMALVRAAGLAAAWFVLYRGIEVQRRLLDFVRPLARLRGNHGRGILPEGFRLKPDG